MRRGQHEQLLAGLALGRRRRGERGARAAPARAGRRGGRSRCAAGGRPTWPWWNRYSRAILPSSQSHHVPFGPTRCSRSPAAIGPLVRDLLEDLVDEPGRRAAEPRRPAPTGGRRPSASGTGGGARSARWRPCAPSTRTARRRRRRRGAASRGCGPRRAKSGSSWLRTSTLTESIWITPMRSNTLRRWRRSTRPVGRGSAKPWAATAMRRAWRGQLDRRRSRERVPLARSRNSPTASSRRPVSSSVTSIVSATYPRGRCRSRRRGGRGRAAPASAGRRRRGRRASAPGRARGGWRGSSPSRWPRTAAARRRSGRSGRRAGGRRAR